LKENLGFRFWFYFRSGWSSYFAFALAALNTLTVTYYLAIEKYPILQTIFPSFLQYVLIIVSIGIPLLILVGYAHWKRTPAYRSEADIWMESNPYQARMLVNSEILIKLNLKLTELLVKQSKNESVSDDELNQIIKLQKEFNKHADERTFANKKDVKFFKNIDS
jgi:hypothetical protein|tara:strand:+ start:22 stop:513 length:492 start_codon:yes stop_codon:yes gene_type:complete